MIYVCICYYLCTDPLPPSCSLLYLHSYNSIWPYHMLNKFTISWTNAFLKLPMLSTFKSAWIETVSAMEWPRWYGRWESFLSKSSTQMGHIMSRVWKEASSKAAEFKWSGQRGNPKEKVHLKNFKVMSSVFNSTFRRYQRSEVDLEDLHHVVTAVVVIISLKRIC